MDMEYSYIEYMKDFIQFYGIDRCMTISLYVFKDDLHKST